MSENLTRVKNSAKQLSALAKEATERIRALDAYLESAGAGIESTDPFKIYSGREKNLQGFPAETDYFLFYGRDDQGKIGICVDATAVMTDAEGNKQVDPNSYRDDSYVAETIWIRRLEQVASTIRIAAVASLPKLVEQIADKLETSAGSTEENLKATLGAVEELREALPAVPAGKLRSRWDSGTVEECVDEALGRFADRRYQLLETVFPIRFDNWHNPLREAQDATLKRWRPDRNALLMKTPAFKTNDFGRENVEVVRHHMEGMAREYFVAEAERRGVPTDVAKQAAMMVRLNADENSSEPTQAKSAR